VVGMRGGSESESECESESEGQGARGEGRGARGEGRGARGERPGGRFSAVIDAPLQGWALEYGPDVCEGVGFYGFVEEVLVWKNGLNV